MNNNKKMKLICFVLTIYTLLGGFTVGSVAEEYAEESSPVISDNLQVGSRFFDLLFGNEEAEKVSLIPGGGVFGVRIKQEYLTVVESKAIPALKSGDVILSIDGKKVGTVAQAREIIEGSEGKSLTLKVMHKGNEFALEVRPTLKDGKYLLGVTLRDGAAGLGTVTFIDPKTGRFGGLGHGICDADSGEVISMENGRVCGVILGGVHKGEAGKPGELCGVLTDKEIGELTVNSECGVFGVITEPTLLTGETLELGGRNEVSEGEAKIISTLKNGRSAEYKVEIYDIDIDSNGPKSFRIKVTDETLKALTGGIVRGMSGSPIIQNGKLVGAVTHVLINDPTTGYGIFIENMLNAAENTVPKAA